VKINGVNHHSNVNPYRTQIEQQPLKEHAQKRDQIQISEQAKQLQQDSKITLQRQEKVEQIKQQIESGNYRVDAEKTASKFYKFWSDQ
jgi:negative regulator of flagellin synthesis FlgM